VGRLVVGALLGWGAVGALAALFLTDRFASDGGVSPADGALAPTLLYVALWAVATPLLLLLAARVRLPAARWGVRDAAQLLLLAAAVAAVAVAHLVAYAAAATRLENAVSVANLPDASLFYVGRVWENVVIGGVLVAGQLVLRHRRRARRRELEAARLAAQLSESRLQALSMELRPHFLFNTLNAISGMVWADQAKADAMVLQLSELLRRTLEAGESPTTSLAEERHVLELYLAIQQVRFGERLTVTVDLPRELEGVEVPRFLLQPLVENAFQHGLAPKRGPVSLAVRGERVGDRLVLRVLDDGVGLPPAASIVESTGVGNMRRRLAALYGASQSLDLRSRPEGGTEVVAALPLRPTVPEARPTP
jgi:signal transduction histidine kinase